MLGEREGKLKKKKKSVDYILCLFSKTFPLYCTSGMLINRQQSFIKLVISKLQHPLLGLLWTLLCTTNLCSTYIVIDDIWGVYVNTFEVC